MTIAICDDNDLTLQLLRALLEEYMEKRPNIPIKLSCFSSGIELLNDLDNHKQKHFDVYILDILMPVLNGIEVGKDLRSRHENGAIIYLTSSSDYAVASYDVKAYYYLLKPLDANKLFSLLDSLASAIALHDDMVQIRIKQKTTLISLSQLLYVELKNRIIHYNMTDGTVLYSPSIQTSFKHEIAQILEQSSFAMCGASYAVNLKYIVEISDYHLQLMNGVLISVPRNHYSQLKGDWNQYRLSVENITV